MKKSLLLIVLFGLTFNFANAQNVLLNEGFETWPAAGWATYELGESGGWEQDPMVANNGDHCAKHPGANDGQNKNYLVSPSISLDNETNYELSFYSFAYINNGVIDVRISTGSGDPNSGDFQVLQSLESNTYWEPVSIDLSAYQGENVYIAFYVFTNTVIQWRVDDVLVAPISYFDAGLTEIVSPTGYNPDSGMEDVVVTLTNHGTEPITDFEIQWTVSDEFQPQFIGTGSSIAPNTSVDVTIGQFDFTEGVYEIAAIVNVDGDSWEDNNLVSSEYSVGVALDLALNSITPSGSYPEEGIRDVIINVSNHGISVVDNLTIEWSVNDIAQPDFNVADIDIQPGASTSITIGQYNFAQGTHYIDVNVPLDFDLTPANNSYEQSFTVAAFYEDFQGDYPPLLWDTDFTVRGNFAPQNSDPDNYHVYMQAGNNTMGIMNDTTFTPLLDIEDGDTFSFMLRYAVYLPGTITLIWKDGETGDIHVIDEEIIGVLGWSEYTYDISEAAGINALGWVCSAEGVVGNTNMDDVSSTAPIYYRENDLLVKEFDLDTVPQINIPQVVSVNVVNIGLNPVLGSEYAVNLMNGSNILTSVSGANISAPGEVIIAFPYTFTEIGDIDLHIEIDYDNDQSLSTNTTPTLRVYPVPENTVYSTIGHPDNISDILPFGPIGTEYSGEQDLSQTLYYSNEIGAAGDIYGIKYYYENFGDYGGSISLKVWIAETPNDNLASGWYPSNSFQLVFDGEIEYCPTDGYTYIPFDTPLSYDGTQNLVVQNYAYEPIWMVPITKYYIDTSPIEIRSVAVVDRGLIDTDNPPLNYSIYSAIPTATFVVSPNVNAGTISGFVYDTDNNPLENAEVKIDGTTVSAFTDANGFYSLPPAVFDEYSITASLFAYDDQTQVLEINQTNENLDFILGLKPLINLTGTIVGSNDLESPLADVSIILEEYFDPYQTTSNSTGNFNIDNVYGNVEYILNLSLYGYEDYSEIVTIEDIDLDLGTLVMQESLISTYNVNAAGDAWETTITWNNPNSGIEATYIKDEGFDASGFANEPNENVWLGNYFANAETITINDVDIRWSFEGGGASDFVTVEILNADQEVIAVSEKFLTSHNQWVNVDVPNMTITGDFYVMVHWEENPETTNYLSYDFTWDNTDENTAVIKYQDVNAQYLNEYLEWEIPALNFLVRPNVIEQGNNGNDNNTVSYNVYKGLAGVVTPSIEEDGLWEMLNTSPISGEMYSDSWSSDYTDGDYMYAVEAVYTDGSAAYTFSNTINILITGIEEIMANDISVYPNPSSEFVNITGTQGSDLHLYDAMGKLVYSEHIETEQTQLDVSYLATGSYILTISLENHIVTKKVFITKQ